MEIGKKAAGRCPAEGSTEWVKCGPLLLTLPVRRRSYRHAGKILGNSHRTRVALSLYYLPSGIGAE